MYDGLALLSVMFILPIHMTPAVCEARQDDDRVELKDKPLQLATCASVPKQYMLEVMKVIPSLLPDP